MRKFTKRWATKIIGNSAKVLDSFYPDWKGEDKFAVVHNGVDVGKFSPDISGYKVRSSFDISPNSIVIGHIGSFRFAKNHHVLLQSFARLKSQVGRAHLLLVGDGKLRVDIENYIDRLRIGNCVTLTGRSKKVPEMLGAMDIFFFPSIYEGQPMALIEAMACGLPVVASNIGEFAELIPISFKSQLFAADNIDGFTEALKVLCLDKARRKALGIMARKHIVEKFSLDASVKNLCSYLQPH
jgi:glycosyltransferase involved in cell wall biosynthesis